MWAHNKPLEPEPFPTCPELQQHEDGRLISYSAKHADLAGDLPGSGHTFDEDLLSCCFLRPAAGRAHWGGFTRIYTHICTLACAVVVSFSFFLGRIATSQLAL